MTCRRFLDTPCRPTRRLRGFGVGRLGWAWLVAWSAAVWPMATSARADESLEAQLIAAGEAYQAATAKARGILLSAFDDAEDAIRMSSTPAEQKQEALRRLRQEKADFEQHGWYPWSGRMRQALANFVRDRASAERALAARFDKLIDAHTRARRDTEAAAVLKQKKDTLAPALVARWEIAGVSWKGSWTAHLYSNGHYSDPYGKAIWTLGKGVVTLTQPEAGLPRGIKILKWRLRDSGTELDEVGNNGSTSTGKLVNRAAGK